MRGIRIQGIITAGRWTLPAVIFISTICWIATGWVLGFNYSISMNYAPLGAFSDILHNMPIWLNKLLGFILYAVIGYFLIEINNVFGIIRMRASVQTSLYFLLITACPAMHLLYPGDIASVSFLLSLYFLFKSYHQHRSSGCLFYSFMFMSVGTMFFPQLIYFVPLWLAGAIKFQSLNPRSFCATLIGFSFPYWFLFGHAFFYQNMELFYAPFREMVNFRPIDFQSQMPLWEVVTLGYLFILYVGSAIHYMRKGYQDKIQSRSYIDYLLILTFYILVFILLQPGQGMNLFPLLLISTSILTAHLFVLTKTKASNIFFICSMVGLIVLFGFNIWTLL